MTNDRYQRDDKNFKKGNRFNSRRRSAEVTNLMKSFSSFSEGYTEILKLVPEVKSYGGEAPLYESVITSILNTIKNNIPSTNNSNYPNTFSFNINAHEVGLLTDSGLAIGWRTYFDRDSGTTVYKFRVSFLNINTYQKTVSSKMQDNGWTIAQKTFEEKSKFWKSITRSNESNSHKDKYRNQEEKDGSKHSQNTTTQTPPPVADDTETEENAEYNPDIVAQLHKAGYSVSEGNDTTPAVTEIQFDVQASANIEEAAPVRDTIILTETNENPAQTADLMASNDNEVRKAALVNTLEEIADIADQSTD